jgi:hypothetical protein
VVRTWTLTGRSVLCIEEWHLATAYKLLDKGFGLCHRSSAYYTIQLSPAGFAKTIIPMQAFGRKQISVQVSGFWIWGLLTPDTCTPIPDEYNDFTLTTHLRILRRSYGLRL